MGREHPGGAPPCCVTRRKPPQSSFGNESEPPGSGPVLAAKTRSNLTLPSASLAGNQAAPLVVRNRGRLVKQLEAETKTLETEESIYCETDESRRLHYPRGNTGNHFRLRIRAGAGKNRQEKKLPHKRHPETET